MPKLFLECVRWPPAAPLLDALRISFKKKLADLSVAIGSVKDVYPVRRKSGVYANFTDSAFGKPLSSASATEGVLDPPFTAVLGQKEYVVPVYFSGSDSPLTRVQAFSHGKTKGVFRSTIAEQRRTAHSLGGKTRRLSSDDETNKGQLQGDTVQFTAADFAELYVGQTSLRRKYKTLVAQKFLDWQLHALQATWLIYNGDSDVFMLNSVGVGDHLCKRFSSASS